MSKPEGHVSGTERLRGKKTLAEVLAVATEFERTAQEFYASLAPKVSKNLRWLVEELAAEESRHYELFKELGARNDLAEQLKAEIATPVADGRFSDCIHMPDLGEHPDDQAVLQYAMGREHAAMEQYRALSESVEPGAIRDLFEFLANEETKHKGELEALYYEIIHSGGV